MEKCGLLFKSVFSAVVENIVRGGDYEKFYKNKVLSSGKFSNAVYVFARNCENSVENRVKSERMREKARYRLKK